MEHEHVVCDLVQHYEDWIDVLGNGLLKKTTLISGNNQLENPQTCQTVNICIRTMLENRKEIETPKNLSFIIGSGDVSEALEICVPLMKLEETILILADVRYCFHRPGCQPPGSRLLLEVKLLSITGCSIKEKSEGEQLEIINRKREKGNNYFQSKDYQLALFTNTCALKIIESVSKDDLNVDQKNIFLDEKVKCYSNMAACHLKTGNLKETISCCDVVLQHQPHHCKALFRKGKVLALQQIYPLAIVFLKKALAVEPEHPEIKEEIKTIIDTWTKQRISGITEKLGDRNSRVQTTTRHMPFKNIPWKWTIGISTVVLGCMILYKWR